MMTDKSTMPFGKYKGKMLIEIPGKYLIYLLDQNIARGDLKEYIENNRPVLAKENRN